MKYSVLDEELLDRLDDTSERKRWLILEPHEDYRGQWHVQSFDPDFFFHLGEEVGPYRVLSPNKLEAFSEEAARCDYNIAFVEDPTKTLSVYEHLNDEPVVTIESPFDNTIRGFLPFQVQGFNMLRDLDAGVVMWSTGTGKTVVASALLKYRYEKASFDTAFFVVKSHNKTNTQRTLKRLVGLESTIIDGSKSKRTRQYSEICSSTTQQIVITNYEKFRVDLDSLLPIFEANRILVIWDEMPTKLKNRTTRLYKSVCRCLYSTTPPAVSADRLRPSHLSQFMLSATPIEKDPEDWFNCVRLLDPKIYGPVARFHNDYVRSWNYFDNTKPDSWRRLDRMGLSAAHIVHQVDKQDPDIAKLFPEVISEPYFIDWDEQDRRVYDEIIDRAKEIGLGNIGALALITVLQMFCDAPEMLLNSAAVYAAYMHNVQVWLDNGGVADEEPIRHGSRAALALIDSVADRITNRRHTKLDTLRSLLTEVHPNEKICLFSSFNDGLMPTLEACLTEWGVSYVRYGGTAVQRQAAEDLFKSDPNIRVFLSSDAGSDSINLEVGSVVIHYDLPWNWSTYIQRENRIHRVTSKFRVVRFYTLLMVDSVEDRRLIRVLQKMNFHTGVFKGAIADFAASSRMTKDDLLFMIS